MEYASGLKFSYKEEELVDVLEEVKETEVHDLVVYNDDFNTFDHVINTLIKVCNHTQVQAEQCTILIHYKGRCTVKSGSMNTLLPMRRAINEAGIDARIH